MLEFYLWRIVFIFLKWSSIKRIVLLPKLRCRKHFPRCPALHTCSDLVETLLLCFLNTVQIKSFQVDFMLNSFLFQMWPMQTRQQGKLEDTRSSLPLRRYVPLCCRVHTLLYFGSGSWCLPADPPVSSSFTRVRRCWRSRGSLVVSIPVSSLLVLDAMISAGERKRWTGFCLPTDVTTDEWAFYLLPLDDDIISLELPEFFRDNFLVNHALRKQSWND